MPVLKVQTEKGTEIVGGGTITSTGVDSFNGRDGVVISQKGDYTAEMVNAAPTGFGLGTGGKQLTETDNLNDIWQSGWYSWADKKPQNAFGTYCMMLVLGMSAEYFTQIIFSLNDPCYTMKRQKVVSNVIEEWVNPPMTPDVEYRTTERYEGNPVYVKVFSNIAGPAATDKAVIDISGLGVERIVDFGGCLSDADKRQSLALSYYLYESNNGLLTVDYSAIQITASRTSLTGYKNCTVWIKYTK